MPPETSTGAFETEAALPWDHPVGVSAVVTGWQAGSRVWRNVALHERIDARAGHDAPLPASLAPALVGALRSRGIDRLYAHQAQAHALARAGRDVVVATPTASGKSLCYNLPVLEAFASDASARALYLFPTKALARDQEAALRTLMQDAGLAHGALTYDGDTPGDARRAGRERSAVVLTNPDMLHAGILPHHALWARFFSGLRYVVIDELHGYRGVFGSHLANVLRRLDRIARHHGAQPVYVMASATIGNPREHASRMLGREVALVSESGAPQGPRRVLVYNPPVVNAELGIRESYLKAAVRLAGDLVEARVTTLLFGQSRNSVEVMLRYLRDRLARRRIDPACVASYRGGYLPGQRREIERALREGSLRCVVSTNALELGIDVGALDAVVCAGYPGSLASLWQRFGRAGRRGDESLALLVASSAPLDQYVALHADSWVARSVEEARIDPDNVEILLQHLKCAAFELPFRPGEGFGGVAPEVVGDAAEHLVGHGVFHATDAAEGGRSYHWAAQAYPANDVSLRSAGRDNVVVIDLATGEPIAEMDWRSAHTMLHEQAIYQHDADTWQVERLDLDNHKAFVRAVDVDFYTDAQTHVRVSVIEREAREPVGAGSAERGEVSVVERVVGFKKIKYHTHENVGYGDVTLPEMQMQTSAFWITVPEDVVRARSVERPVVIDALWGLGHALHLVAAVGLMVDPRDLGMTLGDRTEPDALPARGVADVPGFDPTLFLYDHVAGGIGLAPRLFQTRAEVLARARALIERCACDEGCPACVGPVAGVAMPMGARAPGRRSIALSVLAALGAGAAH